jgi:hypothetical protein
MGGEFLPADIENAYNQQTRLLIVSMSGPLHTAVDQYTLRQYATGREKTSLLTHLGA